MKVYDETEEALAAGDNSLYAFLIDLSYKRRIFEVLLDVILILLAYWGAYAVKFGALSGSNGLETLSATRCRSWFSSRWLRFWWWAYTAVSGATPVSMI